jgi:hypothetical protein
MYAELRLSWLRSPSSFRGQGALTIQELANRSDMAGHLFGWRNQTRSDIGRPLILFEFS